MYENRDMETGYATIEQGTHHEEEDPPFALVDRNMPQHILLSTNEETIYLHQRGTQKRKICSQESLDSSPPAMVESILSTQTDGSDSQTSGSGQAGTSLASQPRGAATYMDASSTFLLSSLPTVTSFAGGSSLLPHSRDFVQHDSPPNIGGADNKRNSIGDLASRGSIGFSQLMQAADNNHEGLAKSTKMPVVLEEDHPAMASNQTLSSWGTLIPASLDGDDQEANSPWFDNVLCLEQTPTCMMYSPLVRGEPTPSSLAFPLLSRSPTTLEIDRSRLGIRSILIDDECFEVSMELNPTFSSQEVMNIVGNPDLLRLWCEPIRALVVTRSSDGFHNALTNQSSPGEQQREYEGEWIEATTGSLLSPASNGRYIHGVVQAVLDSLGFTSYGRVTMFVERQRGQVGLTVGPFHGGIFASHTIMIQEEGEGKKLRVVDRVRLNKEEDEPGLATMFFCGVFDSLNRCLLPSLSSYMEQVTKSLIRLHELLQQRNLTSGRDHMMGCT